MHAGPNWRKVEALQWQPRDVMDDISSCFEETLISPSVLPGGFSTSLLHPASSWGLGRTFGDSKGLAEGVGMGTGATGCRNRISLTTSSAPPPQVGAAVLRARWPCRYGPRHAAAAAAWAAAGDHGKTPAGVWLP